MSFSRALGLAIVAAAVTSALASAHESDSAIHLDPAGLPRCVETAHGNVLLRWHGDLYTQSLEWSLVEDLAIGIEWGSQPVLLGCAHWKMITTHVDLSRRLRWRSFDQLDEIRQDGASLFGALEPSTRSKLEGALDDIRNGARAGRQARTPAEYLALNPISEFTRELNRSLTRKYGMGFVGELYKLWEESQPKNRDFKSRVDAYIQKRDSLSGATPIAELMSPYTVLIVNGIGNDPKGGRMRVVVEDMEALGAKVGILMTGPYASIQENSALIETQLLERVQQGQKLVIIGTSKSVSEVSGALARLESAGKLSGEGGVAFFITLSGLVDGSVLSDVLEGNPIFPVANAIVRALHEFTGLIKFPSLDSFKVMSSRSLRSWYAELAPKLPRSTVYVNLIGTVPGNALAKDPMIVFLQNKLIRPMLLGSLGKPVGANDGYVEYPGTAMPASWAPKIYRLVMHASHPLTDGDYEGLQIGDEGQRRIFFESLFRAMVDVASYE